MAAVENSLYEEAQCVLETAKSAHESGAASSHATPHETHSELTKSASVDQLSEAYQSVAIEEEASPATEPSEEPSSEGYITFDPTATEGDAAEPLEKNAVPCLYRMGRELGKGSYSTVRVATQIETGHQFAAKVIVKKLMQGREHLVRNEIVVLRRISRGHPSILTMVDYFETDSNLYLITELAKGGELFERIYTRGSYSESAAARLVREITSGVAYLHMHGIVHRDLKPENLLFKTNSESSQLMIADFGLSRIIDEEKLNMLMTTCGTPSYMAPEIFTRKGHAKPVDIWAIGVITYFLLSGYVPFDRDTPAEERQAILAGEFEFAPQETWCHISGDAQRFIRGCLARDPAERLTAAQCLEHRFLTKPYRTASSSSASSNSALMTIATTPTEEFPSRIEGTAMQGQYSLEPEED